MNAPHRLTTIFLLLPFLNLTACEPGKLEAEEQQAGDSWPTRALTLWTDRHEFFIEHELPVKGRKTEFAVHVTDLSDGSPLSRGPLVLRFKLAENDIEASREAPDRPGIYLQEVEFPSSGAWNWTLEVDGERIGMPAVEVYATHETAHAAASDLPEPAGAVEMLKEQQWPNGLLTEVAAIRSIQEHRRTTARVAPRPTQHARVPAPRGGFLERAADGGLPELGEEVEAGQVIGRFRIPFLGSERAEWESARLNWRTLRRTAMDEIAHGEVELVRSRAEILRAESEFERIRDLHETAFESQRALEDARYQLAAAHAAEKTAEAVLKVWGEALEVLDSSEQADVFSAEGSMEIDLIAPVSGHVVAAPHGAGEWLEEGETIAEIHDDRVVFVEVRVSERDLAKLTKEIHAELMHPSEDSWIELPGPDGRVRIAAPAVDPRTRSGRVVFEIPNPGWLRIGMTLEAQLAVSAPRRGLSIPASALVDEDGVHVVYVQTAGETFDRRPVRLGIRDAGRVEILSGLEEGERVVVEGAYIVRLTSLSGVIPEHHH